MSILYQLKNVSKFYNEGRVCALSNINLKVYRGEILVILGPSGSGKSTLLNILGGIDVESNGKMLFQNRTIQNIFKYRKENIGFIFQDYYLINNLTVKENIELAHYISKAPFRIDEVMELVNIKHLKHKYPYELSGGERQRVAIARAVVHNPKILICDEPTGALDEQNGKKVLEFLKKINETYHTTIIIVTHNPNIALMSDRIVKMNSGEIKEIIKNEMKIEPENMRWS